MPVDVRPYHEAPGEVPESEIIYVEGLDDEVTVYRDQWGIPHIYAETEDDLCFAFAGQVWRGGLHEGEVGEGAGQPLGLGGA